MSDPTAAAATGTAKQEPYLCMDAFAKRQFAATASNRIDYDMPRFTDAVNAHYERERARVAAADTTSTNDPEACLRPGYAPFCKHLFVPNFTDTTADVVAITDANRHLLRTKYSARTPKELPVLMRYFAASDVTPVKAAYLDCILYSRAQITLETAELVSKQEDGATDGQDAVQPDTAPWGIISIKAQQEDHETPMSPMTAMRNALGREEGGSGVPIDAAAYRASVAYWEKHAIIVTDE